MEEIKPKKERKFLKAMGEIAMTLFRELLINVGKKVINKSGNKRQGLVLAFIVLASTFAVAQYPTTGNKQRLGFQTTGDGLVFRGRASDTMALKPSTINNAYHLFDTLNNVLFSYIKTKGGWKFNNSDTVIIQGVTMPFDSITFNTAKDGTVGVGEVEYNDSQGSLIQGLKGGNVTNVIGQQLHQRVNNRTGATLNKGDVVYLSGSQGNRITVAKALATSDPTSANTFGIVAESIADNQSGYIITEGLITGLNTSSLTQDSAVYLSGTTAGALTSTKPQAPIHGVYIGVCVKTNAGSGEVFVKIRNGQELDELHDVQISSPVNNASLYFKSNEGLWRDTTAALLVSDTSSMLTNYLRTGVAASTYLPLTGGTTNGLITSSFTNTSNYSTSATDNNAFTIYNNTQSTNNIYGGLQFLIGENSGSIPGGPGLAQIYAIRAGGTSNPSTDLTFSTKSNVSGVLEKMRIKFDGKVGIGTIMPSYLLDVNGTLGVSGPSTFLDLQGAGSRMVVAGSGGLLSTQAIPAGTVTSVGGTGSVNGITLSGTVTSSGNLTLGGTLSGVSLSSQVTGTLPIANGGTGATTAATARTALGATVRGANTFLLPDLGAISFLRYNADNTVSQRGADGMRSDLGGTTIGQSMFTLTNPSAITFPRFNADNTVSALDAATFRTAIGAGTGNGNGTVTNVTGTAPISVANGTTTPNITIANAGASTTGVVTATTQTFGGAKTFNGTINAASDIAVTGISNLNGGATIGIMATTSSLTHVLGVNSSNAIGEIALGNGFNLTNGVLNLGGFTSAFLDFPSTSAQSSSDITISYTGAQTSHPVILSIPDGSAPANTNYTAWVSSAGVVKVRFNNYSTGVINPASGTFTIFVLNL